MRTGRSSVFRGTLVALAFATLACGVVALGASVSAAAEAPASSTLKDPYNGGTRLSHGGGAPGAAYMAFVDAAYRKDYQQICRLIADPSELTQCLQQKEVLNAYIALLTQPKSHEVLGGFVKGEEATLDVAYTFASAPRSTGFVVMKQNKGRWVMSSFGGSGSTSASVEASGQVDLGARSTPASDAGPAGGSGPSSSAGGKGPALGKWAFEGKDDKGVVWTGTITLARLDTTNYDASRFYSLCSLDRSSENSSSGFEAPCTWDAAHHTISVSSAGSFEYTAILSADGKSLTQGKWSELNEDFETKKVTVTKTGVWSAKYSAP